MSWFSVLSKIDSPKFAFCKQIHWAILFCKQFFGKSAIFADVRSTVVRPADPVLPQPDIKRKRFLIQPAHTFPSFTIYHILLDLPDDLREMRPTFSMRCLQICSALNQMTRNCNSNNSGWALLILSLDYTSAVVTKLAYLFSCKFMVRN